MPGIEQKMIPKPINKRPEQEKKLDGKVAIITGGDSGIGKMKKRVAAMIQGEDIAGRSAGCATDDQRQQQERDPAGQPPVHKVWI